MSNFVAQSDGSNLAHRHRIFTNPTDFKSYIAVSGEVFFLICNGYLIMGVGNGVCPGGVANIRLYNSQLPLEGLPDASSISPEEIEQIVAGIVADESIQQQIADAIADDMPEAYPIDAPDRGSNIEPVAAYNGSFVAGYSAEETLTAAQSAAPGVIIGYNAKSHRGGGNVVLGFNAEATADSDGGGDMVVLGSAASGFGQHAIAIGAQSTAGEEGTTERWDIAIGSTASATGQQSIAIGRSADASGQISIAIGLNANAATSRSVALGYGSVTSRNDEVSVGNPGSERLIANVSEGLLPTDAVNLAQLDARISQTAVDAIAALTPIADPTTATVEDVANAFNQLLAALKS